LWKKKKKKMFVENCFLVGENAFEKGRESWTFAMVSLKKFICMTSCCLII
jgi:hypothetical protein